MLQKEKRILMKSVNNMIEEKKCQYTFVFILDKIMK